MQNETISEIYTDDKKSKYSSNPNDTFESAKKKKNMKTFTTKKVFPNLSK